LNMTETDIVRMRRNIMILREERLLPERAISHFCAQLFS
jgi:hypothetical protein